jgi:hypothetical protein
LNLASPTAYIQSIFGQESFSSVLDVSEAIDVAVVCIPARLAIAAAKECRRQDIKNIIDFAASSAKLVVMMLFWNNNHGTRALKLLSNALLRILSEISERQQICRSLPRLHTKESLQCFHTQVR